MKPQKNGFFDELTVKTSGLTVYDISGEEPTYPNVNLLTYTELKTLLKITLTQEERETMIRAFIRNSKRQQGYSALYSLVEVINKRFDMNAKFYPSE